MIRYKVNVLESLKNKGFTQSGLVKTKILGQSALTMIRRGEVVGTKVLDTLCRLLECQPGDIIEYVPDDGNQD